MSAVVPFVASIRSRPEVVRLGTHDAPVITVRVHMPEVWDTLRIDAPPGTPVADIKSAALEQFTTGAANQSAYVVKLRGIEVLNESLSISAAGARNGSTFLITNRHRRPVR
jgi:hypothetical protein